MHSHELVMSDTLAKRHEHETIGAYPGHHRKSRVLQDLTIGFFDSHIELRLCSTFPEHERAKLSLANTAAPQSPTALSPRAALCEKRNGRAPRASPLVLDLDPDNNGVSVQKCT